MALFSMDIDFQSPTYGTVTLFLIREKVLHFMAGKPRETYKIVIGTDSQPHNGQGIDFVTAIVVHRVGEGGIYFWKRYVEKKPMVLRSRIYKEATLSLLCAEEVLNEFKKDGLTKYDLEIHVDIGQSGATRDMIGEVVGMVRGSGFSVKVKPDAYGASKVADRHT
jgi:uncharacterized protein